MNATATATAVWRETRSIPRVLQRTLDAVDGFAETLALLRADGTRRILVTGNGASSYVAHAAWLAALRLVPRPGDRRPRRADRDR